MAGISSRLPSMAKFYSALTADLRDFIARQHLFFTASGTGDGRINLSPKGIDTYRCLDDHTVAYLALTGRGNETAAHLNDDGRITVMLCSLDVQPLKLRLYGEGYVVRPRDAVCSVCAALFPNWPGARQIIVISLASAQTSCGYGIP